MKPDQLRTIANAMKAEVAGANTSAQRLLEPYCLVLFNRNGSLRLHVGHRDRWPDAEETKPFAEAFGVPAEDMEPRGESCFIDSRVSGHIRINTMKYTWTEELPAPLHVGGQQLYMFGSAEPFGPAEAFGSADAR